MILVTQASNLALDEPAKHYAYFTQTIMKENEVYPAIPTPALIIRLSSITLFSAIGKPKRKTDDEGRCCKLPRHNYMQFLPTIKKLNNFMTEAFKNQTNFFSFRSSHMTNANLRMIVTTSNISEKSGENSQIHL